MEQDSARPKTLPSYVSVGTANLVREEPTVVRSQCTVPRNQGRPPRLSPMKPGMAASSGQRGGLGAPLTAGGGAVDSFSSVIT